MAATRKLQVEIERCLKKVTEESKTLEDIWQKVHKATNSNQKEKYESDLEKEMKKLRRLRDQIKSWIASREIKDKSTLLEYQNLIGTQMERFMVLEKKSKTKAYSKKGLQAAQKMDPAQKEREEISTWLVTSIDALNLQLDRFESEIESLLAVKKILVKAEQDRMDDLKLKSDRHRYHMCKLETLLRMLDNMSVEVSQIRRIKEDVEYYIESSQEPDFEENEYIYDDIIGLDELEPSGVGLPSSATMDSNGSPTSLTSSPPPSPPLSLLNSKATTPLTNNNNNNNKPVSHSTPKNSSPSSGHNNHHPVPPPPPSRNFAAVATAPTQNASNKIRSHAVENGGILPVRRGKSNPIYHSNLSSSLHHQHQTTKGFHTLHISSAGTSSSPAPPPSAPPAPVPPPSAESIAPQVIDRAGLEMSTSATSRGLFQSKVRENVTSEAYIPPLLDVAPFRHVPLQCQLQMMEAASHHMPHPSDSERQYLPRTPCQTPSYYPQAPLAHSDELVFYERLSTETLFFFFYYMEGSKAQYLAIKALKKRNWRFHTKERVWIQRFEEPRLITDEYEEGTYIYFNYKEWSLRKMYFTFEYKYLEDSDLN